MAQQLITGASTLQCPHGGQVQIVSANGNVRAGAAVALLSDNFMVAGCTYSIPAAVPIPSPCIKVLWIKPDIRARVGGQPTLSHGSAGICIGATGLPQGPVQMVVSQPKAKAT
jgi:hypothetical protein